MKEHNHQTDRDLAMPKIKNLFAWRVLDLNFDGQLLARAGP